MKVVRVIVVGFLFLVFANHGNFHGNEIEKPAAPAGEQQHLKKKPKSCECGCGEPAPLAPYTNATRGFIKGQPLRFINGHRTRLPIATRDRHNMSHSPEWNAYSNAKKRCENPNDPRWKDYGGRGIKFLFENFDQFFAELGPRPKGKYANGKSKYSVDRENNDGHYEPGNVRWATMREQGKNQRKATNLPHDKLGRFTKRKENEKAA